MSLMRAEWDLSSQPSSSPCLLCVGLDGVDEGAGILLSTNTLW